MLLSLSKVAVGVDKTPESAAAARWAAAVAARHGGELWLVHGYSPRAMYPATDGSEVEVIRSAAHEILNEVADDLRVAAPNTKINILVEAQPIVPLLQDVSRSVDALVLGHHRAGWVERLISGSVSAALSARAHSPVVTVPYGNLAEHGPVVIALDVAAPAGQAMTLAFERASVTDRSVVVVYVVPDSAPLTELEGLYARTAAAVEPWCAAYPDCDVRIQLVNGSPRQALADAVPQASLLVLTRPRAGTALGTWIRSVARAAQQQATCPIAMVDHDTTRTPQVATGTDGSK